MRLARSAFWRSFPLAFGKESLSFSNSFWAVMWGDLRPPMFPSSSRRGEMVSDT